MIEASVSMKTTRSARFQIPDEMLTKEYFELINSRGVFGFPINDSDGLIEAVAHAWNDYGAGYHETLGCHLEPFSFHNERVLPELYSDPIVWVHDAEYEMIEFQFDTEEL